MAATSAALAAIAVGAPAARASAAPTGDEAHAEPLYELIDAAAQRLQTADQVAANKWLTGGPITDPPRVAQILAGVAANAESMGIPMDFVTHQFTNQIDATEAVQYSRFSWWKLDPAAAPTSAPDLSTSRAVIDELNHRMVDEIAEQWPVLRSPECPGRLAAAKSAVAGDRSLDPLYQQALESATRSYCD